MDKVELVSMVDMVDNSIMVDSIDIANIQKTFWLLEVNSRHCDLRMDKKDMVGFWWTYETTWKWRMMQTWWTA